MAPGKALVIMVSEDGQVENRVIDTPPGLPVSALSEASNYLGARLRGRTLDTARAEILAGTGRRKAGTGCPDRQAGGRRAWPPWRARKRC